MAGTDNLLQTEDFAEIERVRSLFATLDDEQRIVREIRKALSSGSTQVIIGRESALTASGELGMVTTLFYKDGRGPAHSVWSVRGEWITGGSYRWSNSSETR